MVEEVVEWANGGRELFCWASVVPFPLMVTGIRAWERLTDRVVLLTSTSTLKWVEELLRLPELLIRTLLLLLLLLLSV